MPMNPFGSYPPLPPVDPNVPADTKKPPFQDTMGYAKPTRTQDAQGVTFTGNDAGTYTGGDITGKSPFDDRPGGDSPFPVGRQISTPFGGSTAPQPPTHTGWRTSYNYPTPFFGGNFNNSSSNDPLFRLLFNRMSL